ncbi:MAG TPA: PilC/PilY family type IV pilus protein [Methylotenera sp.]|jgi:Tfp pilus tip-associated adhesin PilY1
MNKIHKRILFALMTLSFALNPLGTVAEDIDIFTGASAGTAERPNVLIVLDNTSNWARQSQQWPGGLTQGQAEVRSIKNVLDSIGNDINVGVMEFVTNGNANNIGGFMRFPILPMDATNKAALKAEMDEIFGDINGTNEKRNSGTPYGNMAYDMHNYFSGANVGSNSSSLNPPSPRVDERAYDTKYSNFKTPLSSANSCAKNYIIFIGNPNSSGPSDDTAANNTELTSLGCSASNISLPNFTLVSTPTTTNLGTTAACYVSQSACSLAVEAARVLAGDTTYASKSCGDVYVPPGGCPTGTQLYSVLATDKQGTKDLGKLSSCVQNTSKCAIAIASQYSAECSGTGVSCSCTNESSSGCAGGSAKYNYSIVRTKTLTEVNSLGYSSACYASAPAYSAASTDYTTQCTAFAKYASGSGCSYSTPTSTGASSCAVGTSQYTILGNSTITSATPSGTYDTTGKGSAWHLDEWARCIYQKGVPVAGGENQTAAMYTIDVYNAQQNNDHTALLMSAAHQGGGKYFSATNEDAVLNSLKQIFAEIQSVNSTFASASLPVNATNRAQNENQVFIGMFRPDPGMKPRWYGNLKRYQLVFEADGVTVNLGDKNGDVAVNNQTGFISDCAVSYWTTDSLIDAADPSKGYYWSNVPVSPSAASKCAGLDATKVYSDLPDGPIVEKGAIAEVIRKGNNPPTTDGTPTWAPNRNLYTTDTAFGTGLTALSSSVELDATQRLWARGADTQNEDSDTVTSAETRASLHGDVVHSRPLPVTYGDGTGVVYYGSNDGMFRAINAETGKELWALMPFEFAQANFVDRLRNNAPLIKYPNTDMTITPTPIPKSYGWDGSIGIAQDKSNTKVWIYPTMRRGGQMVYAINVTDKDAPSIMWKHGCYAGSCSGGFENMGQSWSAPVVVPVEGYTTEKVALFGGGYDICEDKDEKSPCSSGAKGANIYVVDAGSGALLKSFSTSNSVASEISVVDMNADNKADYGYVGDTDGNIYRVDMVTRTVSGGVATYTARVPSAWTIRKIAEAKDGRKFLFQPALLPLVKDGRVYVAIGSGDREHPLVSHYPYKDDVTNRFYVYLDDLAVTSGDAVDLNNLEDKTADAGCSSTSILPGSAKAGWYMDLNQYGKGEQTVTSAIILGGQVAFSTNRPIPPADGTCSTVLGEARGYWVNLFNASGTIASSATTCGGDRSAIFVGGGLPPSPVTGNVYIDGKPVTVVIGAVDHDGGTSTPISPGKVVPAVNPIRKRIYHKVKGVD